MNYHEKHQAIDNIPIKFLYENEIFYIKPPTKKLLNKMKQLWKKIIRQKINNLTVSDLENYFYNSLNFEVYFDEIFPQRQLFMYFYLNYLSEIEPKKILYKKRISSVEFKKSKEKLKEIISTKIKEKISSDFKYKILKRDNFTCQHCGKTLQDNISLEVDHIIPKCKGGSNKNDNLQSLCKNCHKIKTRNDLKERKTKKRKRTKKKRK